MAAEMMVHTEYWEIYNILIFISSTRNVSRGHVFSLLPLLFSVSFLSLSFASFLFIFSMWSSLSLPSLLGRDEGETTLIKSLVRESLSWALLGREDRGSSVSRGRSQSSGWRRAVVCRILWWRRCQCAVFCGWGSTGRRILWQESTQFLYFYLNTYFIDGIDDSYELDHILRL